MKLWEEREISYKEPDGNEGKVKVRVKRITFSDIFSALRKDLEKNINQDELTLSPEATMEILKNTIQIILLDNNNAVVSVFDIPIQYTDLLDKIMKFFSEVNPTFSDLTLNTGKNT